MGPMLSDSVRVEAVARHGPRLGAVGTEQAGTAAHAAGGISLFFRKAAAALVGVID